MREAYELELVVRCELALEELVVELEGVRLRLLRLASVSMRPGALR